MEYPYKYPELYAELARQGKEKGQLAKEMGITSAGLRYKQSKETTGDFTGEEMKRAALYLGVPAANLFELFAAAEKVG